MKRLADQLDDKDPDASRLGQLLASAGPLPRSELSQRRVLSAVRQRLQAGTAPPRSLTQTALAAGVPVVVGGVALLAMWAASRPAPRPEPPAPAAVQPAPLPPPAPTSMPAPAAIALADPSASPAVAAPASRPRPPVPLARRPSHPDLNEDEAATALVTAAVRVLRYEHNPERARVMLDDYLSHHPDGLVAEAALALSIEAAASQADPEAATLAKAYLSRYPAGRYADAARNAITRFRTP